MSHITQKLIEADMDYIDELVAEEIEQQHLPCTIEVVNQLKHELIDQIQHSAALQH